MLPSSTRIISKGVHRLYDENVDICSPYHAGDRICSLVRAHYLDYSVRYISNSSANFSLFRMVVRFLCGLLSDKAAVVLSIISRYLTPQLIDMPMTYQLYSVQYIIMKEGRRVYGNIFPIGRYRI